MDLCTPLIYVCTSSQYVQVNVSETYLPFFLTYPSICIREKYIKTRESTLFSAVCGPTSVLWSMPLSNTSTTKLDNFDGNWRSARRRWPKLADESAGNSLPTFHQVCNASRDPTRSSSFFTRIRCAFTRAHIPKLFADAKFLSEILYATGKHRHDSRICAGLCFIATTGE